jgi:hypothetical protein
MKTRNFENKIDIRTAEDKNFFWHGSLPPHPSPLPFETVSQSGKGQRILKNGTDRRVRKL